MCDHFSFLCAHTNQSDAKKSHLPLLRDVALVRALASHQCGLGSIPRLSVICGFSLLVLYSAPRGFSPGTPVSPLLKNQHLT